MVEEYAALPRLLQIRELAYRVRRPGFRVRSVTLVTTLLDPITYPAESLADLYHTRWGVETDLAHLKTTLGMDVLHCETEAGVLKEPAVFAVVDNLVRVDRIEPRCQKRRAKRYPHMIHPRQELRRCTLAQHPTT